MFSSWVVEVECIVLKTSLDDTSQEEVYFSLCLCGHTHEHVCAWVCKGCVGCIDPPKGVPFYHVPCTERSSVPVDSVIFLSAISGRCISRFVGLDPSHRPWLMGPCLWDDLWAGQIFSFLADWFWEHSLTPQASVFSEVYEVNRAK